MTMKFYPEDYNVEVVVKFTDLNGAAITPTAIRAVLYDGDDLLLLDMGSLPFDPAAGEKSIVVPSAFNGLADGQAAASRILRMELVTAAGTVRRSFTYVVQAEQSLIIMTNTFQTYEAAELQTLEIPSTSGWDSATDERRRAALAAAFNRLTSIPMKYALRDADGRLVIEDERIIERDQWAEITKEDFAEFPTHFRKALRRAQFIEANEILQGDVTGRKHRAGIVTETIGESSVTLRAGKVDYGISSQTMQALAGYIYFNMRIARA